MVAGDVVQGISALGAAIAFQPAAGVECMITTTSAGSGTGYTTLTDGVVTQAYQFPNANNALALTMTLKLFITNSIYLNVALQAGQNSSYSGIQIK
jgi:hypothetical protein